MRPLIVTLVFLAVFLLALERVRTQAERSRFDVGRFCRSCRLVWCNCQGLAPLGPLLVAMYLVGAWLSTVRIRHWPFASENASSVRPLAIVFGLCALASFVTPYGLDAVALPLRLLGRISQGRANVFRARSRENVPPLVLERTAPSWSGISNGFLRSWPPPSRLSARASTGAPAGDGRLSRAGPDGQPESASLLLGGRASCRDWRWRPGCRRGLRPVFVDSAGPRCWWRSWAAN